MKKLFYLFVLSLLIHVKTIAQNPIVINGDFNKSIVVINNIQFNKNSSLADYEKVLGKAERIEKVGGKDKVFIYDKLGIALSLKANTDVVQDISITYIYDGDRKVAKETFTGKLSINGKEITNKSTHEEVSKQAGLTLVMSIKGMYMGKGKSMNLVVYYPDSTIGQFGFNFSELK